MKQAASGALLCSSEMSSDFSLDYTALYRYSVNNKNTRKISFTFLQIGREIRWRIAYDIDQISVKLLLLLAVDIIALSYSLRSWEVRQYLHTPSRPDRNAHV
jgi:hypothetical protein